MNASLESALAMADRDLRRAEKAEAERDEALAALRAVSGYLLNAKIDLETNTKRSVTISTIDGGLKFVRAILAKHATGEKG